MGKKLLIFISLFALFTIIDVKALSCSYNRDSNGISVNLNKTGSNQWQVAGSSTSGSYSFQIRSSSSITTTNRCPGVLYYRCSTSACFIADNSSDSSFPSSANYKNGILSFRGTTGGSSGGSGSVLGPDTADCPGIFGDSSDKTTFLGFMSAYVFKPIRYLTPLVLIIFTTIDFAKAIFVDEKDGMNKAKSNFVKRAVAALIIFLAPTVVSLLLTIINDASIADCLNSSGIGNL